MTLSRERWAQVGISAQFLALVRILSEFFRLKHAFGASLSPHAVEPLIRGALMDAVLCFVAALLLFCRRYTIAIAVSVATVVLLLAYKFYLLGWL